MKKNFLGILGVGATREEAIASYSSTALGNGATMLVQGESVYAAQESIADKLVDPANGKTLTEDRALLASAKFASESTANQAVKVQYTRCLDGCGMHVVHDNSVVLDHCPMCSHSMAEVTDERLIEEEQRPAIVIAAKDLESASAALRDAFAGAVVTNDPNDRNFAFESNSASRFNPFSGERVEETVEQEHCVSLSGNAEDADVKMHLLSCSGGCANPVTLSSTPDAVYCSHCNSPLVDPEAVEALRSQSAASDEDDEDFGDDEDEEDFDLDDDEDFGDDEDDEDESDEDEDDDEDWSDFDDEEDEDEDMESESKAKKSKKSKKSKKAKKVKAKKDEDEDDMDEDEYDMDEDEDDMDDLDASESACKSESGDDEDEDEDEDGGFLEEDDLDDIDFEDGDEEDEDFESDSSAVTFDALESLSASGIALDPSQVQLSFVEQNNKQPARWFAFHNGVPFASASLVSVSAACGEEAATSMFNNHKLSRAFMHLAAEKGVVAAAAEMGFDSYSMTIDVPSVVQAQATQAADQRIADMTAQVENAVQDNQERLVAALSTALMGIQRGFWRDARNPVADSLRTSLSATGFGTAEALVNNAFDTQGDVLIRTAVNKALELMAKPAEVQNSIAESISGMGVATQSVEDRLSTIGAVTAKAPVSQQPVTGNNDQMSSESSAAGAVGDFEARVLSRLRHSF